MLRTWIDHIGDWNPQLVRELKGRLKTRNVLLTIALSLTIQLLLIGTFYSQLPAEVGEYSRYCVTGSSYCIADTAGNLLIDWQMWWTDVFRGLNWTLAYGLMVPGVYMLVTDLDQEERRGTLNFIRLSPQSARSILLGKLLGTPIIVYLGIVLAFPVHLMTAAQAKVPVGFMVSFYGMLLLGSYFIYSAAMLFGFLGRFQSGMTGNQLGLGLALLSIVITFMIFVPAYLVWNAYTSWYWFMTYIVGGSGGNSEVMWFYWPLSYSSVVAHSFNVLNLGIGIYWIWQSLQRCFQMPGATILSKSQSYWLVAWGEVLLLGFFMGSSTVDFRKDEDFLNVTMIAFSILNMIGFWLLIAMLSNQRQSLLDWMRYRHVTSRRSRQIVDGKIPSKRVGLLQDLIFGEKSPAVVAIALNLLIVAAILLPFVLLGVSASSRGYVIAGMVIVMNMIIFYATIAQLALLMKTPKRGFWAIGMVGLAFLIPLAAATLLSSGNPASLATNLFLFTPLPWIGLHSFSVSMNTAYMAILGQWLALAMVNIQLTRQLKQAGAYASKLLLTGV